jgi:hypothetical protein
MSRFRCECSDPGCPVHPGRAECNVLATTVVYRSDMEDYGGTKMCEDCAADALESGVFHHTRDSDNA